MSVSFLMPLGCFAFIAIYGLSWSKLSKADGADPKGSGRQSSKNQDLRR